MEKIKAVLNLIENLSFSENEKKELMRALGGTENLFLDFLSESEKRWSEKYDNLLKEISLLKTELTRTKTATSATKKKETSATSTPSPTGKKRGRPRKNPLPETPLATKMIVIEEKAPEEKQETAAEEILEEGEKLDFDFLYVNPANRKTLMRCSYFRTDAKVMGVVVPYKNKPNYYFGITFHDEFKKITAKEAQAKAASLPKYHGNSWEILNVTQQDSILAAGEKLQLQLRKYHGDVFSGCYLLNPEVPRAEVTKARFTVVIDS